MFALTLATLLTAVDVPTLSVLHFDNQTGDPALNPLSKGLADMLATDLVAFEGVKVVERSRLEDVLKEVDFQQTKYVDKKTAVKLGQILGATYLVVGAITANKAQFVLDVRLVDATTGEGITSVKEQDVSDKVFDIEQRVANGLVAKIDAKLSANDTARRRVKVPNLAALIEYGKGLELADQGKLEEAQATMRALVSKAPLFLLARERQQALLKAFEEYQKRKGELIAGSVLEIGKTAQQTLANEAKFDELTLQQKTRFLVMRMFRGRFLARALKQHFSSRDDALRVARLGSEGKALLAMREWADNQRRYISEYRRTIKQHSTVNNGATLPPPLWYDPTPEEERLFADAKLGDVSLRDYLFIDLAEFELAGRLYDGTNFTVAPALASADPKENKAVRDELDAEIKAEITRAHAGDSQAENRAQDLLELKADLFDQAGDAEQAVVTYQQALDAFPTSNRAASLEKRVTELLKGSTNTQREFEHWAEALKTCDDMKIRMSISMVRRRMKSAGLQGIDDLAADLEKACLPATKRTQSAFAQLYIALGHDAARHDDCNRYKGYVRKYLEMSGSVSDLMGWHQHYAYCDLGDVVKDVAYLHALINGGWDFDMPRRVVSILSHDQTVLTLSGGTEGPRLPDRKEEHFDLRLERQPDGSYKCTTARWRRDDGKYIEGSCSVAFKTLVAKDAVGFDEGTFEARFETTDRGPTTLTSGRFRARRE